jgi:hypothetical protein
MMGGEYRKIKKNDVVYNAGDELTTLYKINKGKTKTYTPTAAIAAKEARSRLESLTSSLDVPQSANLQSSTYVHQSMCLFIYSLY